MNDPIVAALALIVVGSIILTLAALGEMHRRVNELTVRLECERAARRRLQTEFDENLGYWTVAEPVEDPDWPESWGDRPA